MIRPHPIKRSLPIAELIRAHPVSAMFANARLTVSPCYGMVLQLLSVKIVIGMANFITLDVVGDGYSNSQALS